MSALLLLQDDATTEALFIRFCNGNGALYRHHCDRAGLAGEDALLTRWERLAIWLYATTNALFYRDINIPLRDGAPSDDIRAIAHVLGCGLQKLPRHGGLVARGIKVPDLDAFLTEYIPGAEVVWPAFSSSSSTLEQAVVGNVLFMVQSKNGRVLGPYADLQAEREVLFPPQSRFRIDGTERRAGRAIIDMTELVSPLETSNGDRA